MASNTTAASATTKVSSTKGKKSTTTKSDGELSDVDVPLHNLTLSDSDSEVEMNISVKKPIDIPATVKEETKRGRKPKTVANVAASVAAAAADTTDRIGSADRHLRESEALAADDESAAAAATPAPSSVELTSAATIDTASGDETEQDGTWTTRLTKNLDEVKTILDLMEFLKKNYNGMDETSMMDIWNKLCNKPIDEMKKLYAKNKKRQVKQKAKFAPKDLTKPPRCGRDIFMKELTAKNKAATPPITMNLAQQNAEWKKQTPVQQDRYTQMAEKAKKEYADAVAKQKTSAIEAGDFPEPAPKRPITSYLRFRTDYLPKVKAKLPDVKAAIESAIAGKTPEEEKAIRGQLRKEYNVKMEAALKDKWDNLATDKKKLYVDAAAKDKQRYETEYADWAKRCDERKAAKAASK